MGTRMIMMNVLGLRMRQHLEAARKIRQKFWKELDAFYPRLRDDPDMRRDLEIFDKAMRDALAASERIQRRSHNGRYQEVAIPDNA